MQTEPRSAMGLTRPSRRWAAPTAIALAGALTLAACDRTPLGHGTDLPGEVDGPPPPAGALQLTCTVDVPSGEMSCATPKSTLPEGLHADRIVGGQDLYVKLSSANTAYDAGSAIFRTDVTVQNLTGMRMGTPDGVSVEGIRIFFNDGPTVTDGSGTVTLSNADGTDLFTAADQPYFLYPTLLRPLEQSDAKEWLFVVPNEVNTFTFEVFVAAELFEEDPDRPLLDAIWSGMGETAAWLDSANWRDGVMPDSMHSVSVPPMEMMEGERQPVLAASTALRHLRVGAGNTLDLGGNTLNIREAVDAVGPITNGRVVVIADSVGMVSGTFPDLQVAGPTEVQGGVTVTGVLTVSGPLLVRGGVVEVGGGS